MKRMCRLVAIALLLSLVGGLASAQVEADAAKRIEGIWTGIVDARVTKFTMTFHIKRGSDGTLTGSFYSRDVGLHDVPVDSITLTDDNVVIDLRDDIGRFEAKLETSPEKLSGVLHHPAGQFTGVFERAEALPQFANVPVTRIGDVIYGKKHGVALTLDVCKPEKPNGIGVILVVSGGWISSHDAAQTSLLIWQDELIARGYTLFAVVHGSQPYYTIPEVVEDISRSVRFVRFHAAEYGIDPNRLGITGGSAGGHLSLMQGIAGDDGDPNAKDPVDRVSSRVQAVACLYPPTDFLNYGKPGENAVGRGILKDFKAAFTFREYDEATRALTPVTDEAKILDIARSISPIYHVTSDDAATFILHGDADVVVPIQQSQTIVAKLKEAGVPAELMVKPGANHGWAGIPNDVKYFADWFDKYLAEGAVAPATGTAK